MGFPGSVWELLLCQTTSSMLRLRAPTTHRILTQQADCVAHPGSRVRSQDPQHSPFAPSQNINCVHALQCPGASITLACNQCHILLLLSQVLSLAGCQRCWWPVMYDASLLSTSVCTAEYTCPAECWRTRHQHLWPVLFNANPLRIPQLHVEDFDDLPEVALQAQGGQADAGGPAEGQPAGPKPPAVRFFETMARTWGCDPAEVVAHLNDGSAVWAFKMFASCASSTTAVRQGLCLICLCSVWENMEQVGPRGAAG